VTETTSALPQPFDQWAILELMGHVRLAGRVSEVELFGTKMGRIDVPNASGGFTTQLFGGASVYRLTPCAEDVARAVAASSQPQPVHRWELPAPKSDDNPVVGRVVGRDPHDNDEPGLDDFLHDDKPF
jgi:hypothetical protein